MDTARHQLEDRLAQIIRRNEAVGRHLRHDDGRMEEHGDDRASWMENDEVLEALDEAGRAEVLQIRAALSRMDHGTHGKCSTCGVTIGAPRLAALPFATECVRCAT